MNTSGGIELIVGRLSEGYEWSALDMPGRVVDIDLNADVISPCPCCQQRGRLGVSKVNSHIFIALDMVIVALHGSDGFWWITERRARFWSL